MKKIQYFLFALMFVFALPLITACDNSIHLNGISFDNDTYVVVQGDDVQLTVSYDPREASNKEVSYAIVSGGDYATVSSTGLVTANEFGGEVTQTVRVKVTSKDKGLTDTCDIKVLPTPISLNTPEVVYDATSGKVKWDKITQMEFDANYSPKYSIIISKNGQENTYDIERNTAYSINGSGIYVVRVKSVSDVQYFSDSNYSEPYTFVVLDAPKNLSISNTNKQIVVDKIESNGYNTMGKYTLKVINKTTLQDVSENFVKDETGTNVVWTIPTGANTLSAGEYNYYVYVEGDGETFFTSANTTEQSFIQLGQVTNVVLQNKSLTWSVVYNACGYKVVVVNGGNEKSYSATINSYTFADVLTDSDVISIQAIGNGSNIIDGKFSDSANRVLATPQGLIMEDLTLRWNGVEHADSYNIYVNGNLKESNNTTLQYDFAGTDFVTGGNTIGIEAVSSNSSYAKSNAEYTITKLATPTLTTYKGKLYWNGVEDVSNYELSIGDAIVTVGRLTNNYEVDSSYGSGTHAVTIRAKGNQSNIVDSDPSDSENYIKRSVPIDLSISNTGVLKWDSNDDVTNGSYQVIVTNATSGETLTNLTTNTSYNISQYLSEDGLGDYYFAVKACSNDGSKYLYSETSNAVTTLKLENPSNLRISEGKFVWDYLSDTYESKTDDSLLQSINEALVDKIEYYLKISSSSSYVIVNTSRNSLSPTLQQCSVGEHTASIKAVFNSDYSNLVTITTGEFVEIDAFLINSDYGYNDESSSLRFTKLNTPNRPTIYEENIITGTKIVGVDKYKVSITSQIGNENSYIINAINGKWTTTLDMLTQDWAGFTFGTFTISVMSYGEDSYINSEKSQSLSIYKLPAPVLKVDSNGVSWKRVYSALNNIYTPINNYVVSYNKKIGESVYGETVNAVVTGGVTSFDMTTLDVGEYKVSIKAQGSNGIIISSASSDWVTPSKIGNVNISSVRIDDTMTNPEYNTITWDAVTDATGYNLSIYQVYQASNVRKLNTTISENKYTFSDDYNAEEYYITLQAIASGKIGGAITQELKINRLKQIDGISVFADTTRTIYKASWENYNETRVDSYIFYVDGNQELRGFNALDKKVDLVGGVEDVLSDNTGPFNVSVRAYPNGILQENGELIISSASSENYPIVRLSAPTITVVNGNIVWSDNNSVSFGYDLHFNGSSDVKIRTGSNCRSCGMSYANIVAGTEYTVTIKASGNSNVYIDSPVVELSNKVVKLGIVEKVTSNSDFINNGLFEMAWQNNATSYKVITTSGDDVRTTTDIKPNTTCPTEVSLPVSATSGLSGNINLQLQAIGTIALSGIETAYINSNVVSVNTSKYDTPTGLRVNNGEIVWNNMNTTYNVSYGALSENVETNQFIVSEHCSDKITLAIQVCSLSNGNEQKLRSDYCEPITVTMNGIPQSLTVINGALTWMENNDTSSYNDYELLIIDSNNNEYNISCNSNSTTLNNITELDGKILTSIKVRHKGTVSSATAAGALYVNSSYSNVLQNVKKLANVDSEIGDTGLLLWNNSLAYAGTICKGFTYSVNNGDWSTVSNNTEYAIDIDVGYYRYLTLNVQTCVQGSDSDIETYRDDDGYIYLSSNIRTITAYRFAPVYSLDIKNDLKLVWRYDDNALISVGSGATATTIDNDKFLIEYKYLSSNESWESMVVDNITEIPLWHLGSYYKIRISVISSSNNVIRSASVDCTQTENRAFIFNKFRKGDGSRGNPFEISDTNGNTPTRMVDSQGNELNYDAENSSAYDKLEYVNIIPSAFFTITQDIVLPDITTEDILHGKTRNYGNQSLATLTGGIDGNGYTISNYQICSNAWGASLWYCLQGKDRTGAIITRNQDNFYERHGIIENLNLEISYFNFNLDVRQQYFSFFTLGSLGGWIVDCSINLSANPKIINEDINDNIANDNCIITEDVVYDGRTITGPKIKIEELSSNYDIIYGGFVAYMSSKDGDGNKNLNACIIGCTSNINMILTKEKDRLATFIRLGGIVGANIGGSIYNCKNNGSLGGTQVGGVALYCESTTVTTITGVLALKPTISGCQNNGVLISFPVATGSAASESYSGGIVGKMDNGNIVYCLNYGDLLAINGHKEAGVTNPTSVSVVLGGIVGDLKNGYLMNSISACKMTKLDNGQNSGSRNYLTVHDNNTNGWTLGGLIGSLFGTNYIVTSYFRNDLVDGENDIAHVKSGNTIVADGSGIGSQNRDNINRRLYGTNLTNASYNYEFVTPNNAQYNISYYVLNDRIPSFELINGQYPKLIYGTGTSN